MPDPFLILMLCRSRAAGRVIRAASPVLLFAALSCRSETGAPPADEPVVAVVEVTPGALQLRGGDTVRLRGVVYDQFHKPMTAARLAWETNDSSVVPLLSVDDTSAVVTVVRLGTALVAARASGVEGHASVVAVCRAVRGISVAPSPVSLRVADTVRLSVRINTGECSGAFSTTAYRLSSSDTSVVTIEADGATLRGVRPGTATVKVQSTLDASFSLVGVTVTPVPGGDLALPLADSEGKGFRVYSGISTSARLVVTR